MRGLSNRVAALETASGVGFRPYTRIIQEVGQTEEEAIASHEAKNGPLGDDPQLIIRIIV